jgi:5'-deoxynucleotidase
VGAVVNIRDFLLDRRTAHVTRWHHRPTLQSESIAEHHALTARIAFFVAGLLRTYNIEDVDPCRVAVTALFHDEPEILTGDVPGNMKRESPTLREAINTLEQNARRELWAGAPESVGLEYSFRLNGNGVGDVGLQVVKYADDLAALGFLYDERALGNSQFSVQLTIDALRSQIRELDWPWLVKLREREVGLP